MGQSTDAMVFYGYCWPDEDTGFDTDLDEVVKAVLASRGHADPWDAHYVGPKPFDAYKAWAATQEGAAEVESYRALKAAVEQELGTMKQPIEDLLQPLFLGALVVITKELDLGSVAAELEAARAAKPEPPDVAESLAATVRDLDAHIGKRAWELAEPQILAVKDEADAKTAELERELAAADQRFNDLMREIQRQNKARDREFDELKRLRATVHRVRQIRCWQNEDGKWFAFRDDLYAALEGEREN
jgi:uncharacterized protein YdbL (DUF1318 family)